jgi:hypothetical protein
MTPETLGYYKSGNYIIELCRGTGMFGNKYMHGISVRLKNTNKYMTNLSTCFPTYEEAIKYITKLKLL